jgi:hypothetical protein
MCISGLARSHELDTSIASTPLDRVIGLARSLSAETRGTQPLRRYALLRSQVREDGIGACLGEFLIRRRRADVVRVAFNRQCPLGVTREHLGNAAQRAIRDWVEIRGREREVDTGQLGPTLSRQRFLDRIERLRTSIFARQLDAHGLKGIVVDYAAKNQGMLSIRQHPEFLFVLLSLKSETAMNLQ